MSFEQGWISLYQMLAARPDGDLAARGRCAAHNRPIPSTATTCTAPASHDLQVQVQGRRRRDHAGPNGDQVLRLIGKEPAPKGIIEPPAMPAAIAAHRARRRRRRGGARSRPSSEAAAEGRTLAPRDGVSLRQRAWPLVEMMKRAHAAGEDIVWGV